MAALAETVELGSGRLATWEVIGSGEPLLWFMGGPGFGASVLRPHAELLGDRFACHLIDPHGSGGSTPPDDAALYDHLGHARFYDEVRRALGLSRVTVMGSSFGGTVALTYAALFPEVAARCVPVGAFAIGEAVDDGSAADEMARALARHEGAPWFAGAKRTWDDWTERVLAAGDAGEVDAMFLEVLPLYLAHPDDPAVQRGLEPWRRNLATDLAAAKAWESGLYQTIDMRPLLAQIRCPTLALAGELDPVCGPAQANAIAAAVAGADVAIIPDCGHVPPLETPEAFRRTVLEWCDRNPV